MTCRIEECANESGLSGSARGLCRAHYRRWQRYGTETAEPARVKSYGGDVCAEADCSNRAESNGLCCNHYYVTSAKAADAGAENDLPAHDCPPVAAAALYAPSKDDRAIADLVDRQDRVVIVSSRRPLAGYTPERQVIVRVH